MGGENKNKNKIWQMSPTSIGIVFSTLLHKCVSFSYIFRWLNPQWKLFKCYVLLTYHNNYCGSTSLCSLWNKTSSELDWVTIKTCFIDKNCQNKGFSEIHEHISTYRYIVPHWMTIIFKFLTRLMKAIAIQKLPTKTEVCRLD